MTAGKVGGHEAALAQAVSAAIESVLSQPDTQVVDEFWTDAVARTMAGRDMSKSQRGALRELAATAPDVSTLQRHLKRMSMRATRHSLWLRPVPWDGESRPLHDALSRLAERVAVEGFDQRRVELEYAVHDAAQRAGVADPELGYDVERARSARLGATFGYLVRRAQAKAGDPR